MRLLALLLGTTMLLLAGDARGKWAGQATFTQDGQEVKLPLTLEFDQKGDQWTGRVLTDSDTLTMSKVEVKGDAITFEFSTPEPERISGSLTVADDTMQGDIKSLDRPERQAKLAMKREGSAPAKAIAAPTNLAGKWDGTAVLEDGNGVQIPISLVFEKGAESWSAKFLAGQGQLPVLRVAVEGSLVTLEFQGPEDDMVAKYVAKLSANGDSLEGKGQSQSHAERVVTFRLKKS